MRNFFCFIIFIIFFCSCKKQFLDKNKSQTRLDTLIAKAKQLDVNPKDAKAYLEESQEILSLFENDSLKRAYLNQVSNQYFNNGLMDDYLKVCKLNLQLSEQAKDSTMMPIIHYDLSDYYFYYSVFDSAYFHVNKVIKILKNQPDNVLFGRAYLNKAAISQSQNALIEAEIEGIEALKIGEKMFNQRLIYDACNLLGAVFYKMEDYESSLKYHFKALETLSDLKDDEQYSILLSSTNNNLGITYKNQEKFDEAIKYFELGLKTNNLKNIYPNHFASLLDNLAHTLLKKNTKVSLSDFEIPLKIRDSLGLKSGLIYSRLHIGDFYISKKDSTKAIEQYHLAMSLANETKSHEEVLKLLNVLSVLEPSKSETYLKRHIFLSDSLNNAERNLRNKFTRIEYETALVEEEKKVLQKQNNIILGIGISILLISVLFYVIYRQKVKQKELLLIQDQQLANQEVINLMIDQQRKVEEARANEKDRISIELHDGVVSEIMSIRLHFSILSHKIDQSAKDYFSQQMEVLQALEVKIRDISHNLNRDAFLQNQTFGVLIQNLATELETLHSLSINLSNETKIRWDLYPNEYKINIFRTIQESLQNCVKYAKAKEIKISFLDENGTLTWQISDDGVGFDVRKKKKGIGLKNMMSRMALMNGTMEILSEKNKGTTIIFEIPSKNI